MYTQNKLVRLGISMIISALIIIMCVFASYFMGVSGQIISVIFSAPIVVLWAIFSAIYFRIIL